MFKIKKIISNTSQHPTATHGVKKQFHSGNENTIVSAMISELFDKQPDPLLTLTLGSSIGLSCFYQCLDQQFVVENDAQIPMPNSDIS